MGIDSLVELFNTSTIMQWSAGIFLFNLAITLLEILLDLATGKPRRWKDSIANGLIFVMGVLLERLAWGGARLCDATAILLLLVSLGNSHDLGDLDIGLAGG